MTISVRSKFYFGLEIDDTNFAIDFDEGIGELAADLEIGDLTLSEIGQEMARQMTSVGTQEYTATLNRDTRKLTISAPGNFSLLIDTGLRSASSGYTQLGFTGSDLSGSNNYESNLSIGLVWHPQNIIEEYEPIRYNQESIDPSVNESASGVINTISFGERSFMSGLFRLITDLPQNGKTNKLPSNPNARDEAVSFMKIAVKKHVMEFMEVATDTGNFEKVLLEDTEGGSKGTGFKLLKDFDEPIPGYYTLGTLKFREVT